MNTTPPHAAPGGRIRTCPLCRKPRSAEHAPFCSIACKDRDLLRWLQDGYAVPGPPADDPDAGKA